jgi:3-oxoacyl-[acyl-carrier protein] reductase
LALSRAGCSVLVNYSRSEAEAEATAADVRSLGVKAFHFKADVADDTACRAMMAAAASEFGRLDILVNNAGTTEFINHANLEAFDDQHWDRLLAVNLKGPFFCARAARPFMEAAGEGAVVNVTSIAGFTGQGSSIAYCASKAALINLTLSLARTLAPKIRVNAVAPGFIDDKWTQDGLGASHEAVKQAQQKRAVLGRVCQPEDVAEVILSLITSSRMVTGQTLVCDGGFLVGPKPVDRLV